MPRRTLHCLPDAERKATELRAIQRVQQLRPYLSFSLYLGFGAAAFVAAFFTDGKWTIPVIDVPVRSVAVPVVTILGVPWAHNRVIARLAGRHLDEELRGRGLCVRCGYDLCATPTQCPECGRAVDLA